MELILKCLLLISLCVFIAIQICFAILESKNLKKEHELMIEILILQRKKLEKEFKENNNNKNKKKKEVK